MTLTEFHNPSKTSRLRVSTGVFTDDGTWIPDNVFTIEPGETRSVLIDKGRGIFHEEVAISNDD